VRVQVSHGSTQCGLPNAAQTTSTGTRTASAISARATRVRGGGDAHERLRAVPPR